MPSALLRGIESRSTISQIMLVTLLECNSHARGFLLLLCIFITSKCKQKWTMFSDIERAWELVRQWNIRQRKRGDNKSLEAAMIQQKAAQLRETPMRRYTGSCRSW